MLVCIAICWRKCMCWKTSEFVWNTSHTHTCPYTHTLASVRWDSKRSSNQLQEFRVDTAQTQQVKACFNESHQCVVVGGVFFHTLFESAYLCIFFDSLYRRTKNHSTPTEYTNANEVIKYSLWSPWLERDVNLLFSPFVRYAQSYTRSHFDYISMSACIAILFCFAN